MPKLPSAAAAEAKKAAEAGGFTAVEEGPYKLRLTDVKATNAKSSGNPMWTWELESVEEGTRGRKFWVNTVLTEKAMWKVGEMFAAFNAPTDTDTDELIGEHCLGNVVQRTITQGARAGQLGNDVARCEALDEDDPDYIPDDRFGGAAAPTGEAVEEQGELAGTGASGEAASGW